MLTHYNFFLFCFNDWVVGMHCCLCNLYNMWESKFNSYFRFWFEVLMNFKVMSKVINCYNRFNDSCIWLWYTWGRNLPLRRCKVVNWWITVHFSFDRDRLHLLVTERAYPLVTHQINFRTLRWGFHGSLEPPRVVHIRCTDVINKDNVFAQVTVRFHTQQVRSNCFI